MKIGLFCSLLVACHLREIRAASTVLIAGHQLQGSRSPPLPHYTSAPYTPTTPRPCMCSIAPSQSYYQTIAPPYQQEGPCNKLMDQCADQHPW